MQEGEWATLASIQWPKEAFVMTLLAAGPEEPTNVKAIAIVTSPGDAKASAQLLKLDFPKGIKFIIQRGMAATGEVAKVVAS